MHSKNTKLLKHMENRRHELGLTQAQLGARLHVKQGHISKILRSKVPISAKMLPKIQAFIESPLTPKQSDRELEDDILAAIRSSESFSNLMRAALKMHKNTS
ncbi:MULTISPECIES: helix-turn-helix transcriptional regulator [unclassified Mesorhizobium]|uniref:helix-turn-helix domain-containing protein n=1 Tax=unclassified Mesorhizobium TaxID=325217 RepID=UPI0015CE3F56|nr:MULTISPECIES: helix-turn-helix transcriptional regulator [unclassified Mesorhizobium]